MLRNVALAFDKTPGAVIRAGAFFFIGARRIFQNRQPVPYGRPWRQRNGAAE